MKAFAYINKDGQEMICQGTAFKYLDAVLKQEKLGYLPIGSFKHTMACLGGNWKEPFSGWKQLVDKYKIKFWAYKDELLNDFTD